MNKYKRLRSLLKQKLQGYDSGHDWWHIERVRRLALFINEMEQLADPFIVEITALLHDTADSKFSGGENDSGYALIGDFMNKSGMSEIRDTGFKRNKECFIQQ